jgi:DNA (cytosine-5)-methyltransferase 1
VPRRFKNAVAIDLFCGAGGLSLGLAQAGFTVAAAVDNDPVAIRSYRENIGPHAICKSVEEVSTKELLSIAKLKPGECTLVAGGPPCQGFSVQRRGDRGDPRNELVLQFVRFVEEIRPRFFLMENVGGLLSKHGKKILSELSARLSKLDYLIQVRLLDAVDYGVPQRRKRAVLVGELTKNMLPSFVFPEPVASPRHRTVRDAIGDLPSPPKDGSCHPGYFNHFREARLSPVNIERIRHVPQGGGREDLPDHLQLKCHRDNVSHRHMDVYGRLAWDDPSVTLTARFDSFTRGRFGHPVDDRSLTIREGARIQTFPDSFSFAGNREDQARQVGNAVPPLMAETIGRAILDAAGLTAAQAVAA